MPGVESINSANHKPFLRAGNTGYAALLGLGLTTTCACIKKESVRKYHKPLAYVTAGLTILHLGTILYHRNEWKKQQKEFIA